MTYLNLSLTSGFSFCHSSTNMLLHLYISAQSRGDRVSGAPVSDGGQAAAGQEDILHQQNSRACRTHGDSGTRGHGHTPLTEGQGDNQAEREIQGQTQSDSRVSAEVKCPVIIYSLNGCVHILYICDIIHSLNKYSYSQSRSLVHCAKPERRNSNLYFQRKMSTR